MSIKKGSFHERQTI
uniref:Uncharacterized protein n=1 Tax=Anguilla anguilla TaxID=7936 RepID=A0A0E9QT45_ANGAN